MVSASSTAPAPTALRRVVWLAAALFVSYLGVAMSLPVTSVFVVTRLAFGNAVAGLAVGIAFASTILTRGAAGRHADRRGGKPCMIQGLLVYAAAALLCAGAGISGLPPAFAYGVLVAGRLLLGWGESLATVGLLAWALGVAGPQRSGRVFGIVGIGMYGSFAVGGPLGVLVFEHAGFAGVMAACALVPLLGLAMVAPMAGMAPQAGQRPSFWRVLGRIWQPGLVVGLQGVGFAALGAFVPLLFLHRGWPHAGLGLTCFGGAFVLVRLLFGHMPDRVGGVPVALVSLAVEAAGQLLLWTASGPTAALAGAVFTGLGCSLVFPAMGREVVRRIPAHLRGTAAGGLAAFQDLAYGATGPLAGLLADRFGDAAVFLGGALTAGLGFILAGTIARGGEPGA